MTDGYMKWVPQAALDDLSKAWEMIVKAYKLTGDVACVVIDRREIDVARLVELLGAKKIPWSNE